MNAQMPRRRFLTMTAAFAALPAMADSAPPAAEWRGIALGASASLHLVGVNDDAARDTFSAVEEELARLEDIFSLYKLDSALSRLNRFGRLAAPPPEMLELLSLAGAIHTNTSGAFDPTIQPLWALFAKTPGSLPEKAMLKAARSRIGWTHVRITPAKVAFAQPGMAMTLNGIAQGYITDRVADLLRQRGFRDVLVDMGEVKGLGNRPDGRAWQAGVAAPGGRVVHRMSLSDRALATSAFLGTRLGTDGRLGHILDPRTGVPVAARDLVSVSADRAVLADALSTAFSIMDDTEIAAALKAYPLAHLEVTRPLVRLI